MINEYCVAQHVPAADMDRLWALGWRHFGSYFFRYSAMPHDGTLYHVIPLRIELSKFDLSQSQTRVLRRNRDLQIFIRPTTIDTSKEDLFYRHRKRFKDNVPKSLFDFMSTEPGVTPCRNEEICVYRNEQLIAMSFLDIGSAATSAVYAAFEPTEPKRSLGILTMLRAIEYSRDLGARYYYPGYAYREPSMYDYKKKFSGLEFLDWESGWSTYTPFSSSIAPQ
jgi:arginyl-tRNA--protein-N-Asp/Glu arginylyltransferase